MGKTKKTWIFFGDVLVDGFSHSRSIEMQTFALSEKKALNNLKYRYRQVYSLPYGSEIEFCGKIEQKKHEPNREESEKAIIDENPVRVTEHYRQLKFDF